MTDSQILTIALATVPTMITVLIGILINNARLSDLRASIDNRFSTTDTRIADLRDYIDARFTSVDTRFTNIDHRFDEMRDMWRSELHRVEEVLDARLKHLEER
jgi:hypothetical protein